MTHIYNNIFIVIIWKSTFDKKKKLSVFNFIDDLSMKWHYDKVGLNDFITGARNSNPSLKFTHETYTAASSFLLSPST